jgi:phosphatidylglycerophosphate synthase
VTEGPRLGRHRTTVADVIREGQPQHIRTRANAEHWSADIWWRHLSPYVSVTAIRWGLSANAVTVAMILSGWLAAASLVPGTVWGAFLAVVFAHGQMLLDASDGEVARWRRTTSPRGIFLDRIAHTTTESLMPIGFGLGLGISDPDRFWMWVAGGCALGALVLINKSVNDGVAIARAAAGLPKLPDTAAARQPRPGLVARLKRIARLVPLHRLYHSVEQSHVYLVTALVTLLWAPFAGWVLVALLVITPLVIAGHIAAVLTSPRLGAIPPEPTATSQP